MEQIFRGRFYLNNLYQDLSLTAIKVYIYLTSFCSDDPKYKKNIHPSEQTIGKAIGVTNCQRSISEAIKELKEAGLLKVEHNAYSTNSYKDIYFPNERYNNYALINIQYLHLFKSKNDIKLFIFLTAMAINECNTTPLPTIRRTCNISQRALHNSLINLYNIGLVTNIEKMIVIEDLTIYKRTKEA